MREGVGWKATLNQGDSLSFADSCYVCLPQCTASIQMNALACLMLSYFPELALQ